jgi:hypothetical protein
MENCKICGNTSKEIFTAKVLFKYDVKYYQCSICLFMQTQQPFWLEEAYDSAITKQDIGLLFRNNYFSNLLKVFIPIFFNKRKKFLDYGGGYGVFVRLMRDNGFDFYRYDTYCENIFAKGFEDSGSDKYELLTSFEVFEHLDNPLKEIEIMLSKSDSIFFSTELQPENLKNENDWWYIMPWTGQHVSLFSIDSLKFLANKYDLNLYTNGRSFHLLTKKKINSFLFKFISIGLVNKVFCFLIFNRKSYLSTDYKNLIKTI